MDFSVIIPVHNLEQLVTVAIDSVVKAMNFDKKAKVEVVVVDDGSSDGTSSVLKNYTDKYSWIKVLQQDHKGLGAARNFGMLNATGRYILFLDADDYLRHDVFKVLRKKIAISEPELIVFKWQPFGPGNDDNNKYGEFTVKGAWIACWNKCYKRELIIDEKFPENVVYEDTGFFISAWYKAKNKTFIDKALYFYRTRDDGLSKYKHDFETRLECLIGFKEALENSEHAEPVKTIVVETIIKHINRNFHSNKELDGDHIKVLQRFFERHNLFATSILKDRNTIVQMLFMQLLKRGNIRLLVSAIRYKVLVQKVLNRNM